MLVLAHRGANRQAPENTLPAMAAAVDLGADGVELDVHRTADGALVVRHDADTPEGPLAALTLRDLAAARPEVPHAGRRCSTCAAAGWSTWRSRTPIPARWRRWSPLLAARLEPRADDVLVSSFDVATVDRVRAAAPDLPTGFLSFGLPPDDALAIAIDHGHGAVHPDVWTLVQVDVPAFVARAHDRRAAGQRVDGQRRRAAGAAARRRCRRRHHRRRRALRLR